MTVFDIKTNQSPSSDLELKLSHSLKDATKHRSGLSINQSIAEIDEELL